MPHVPNAPPGKRFFARVDRFHCECPNCGAINVAEKDAARHRRRDLTKRRSLLYNPIASQWVCHACRRVFGCGLVVWSIKGGGGGKRSTIPEDQKPSLRQLRELASEGYGLWPDEAKRQGEAVNLAIDAECKCTEGWRASCPVHGEARSGEFRDPKDFPPPPPVEYDDDDET